MEKDFKISFDGIDAAYSYCRFIPGENGMPDDFIFLDVNDAFFKLCDIKKQTIIGKRFNQLKRVLWQSDYSLVSKFAPVALTGNSSSFRLYSEEVGKFLSVTAFSDRYLHFSMLIHQVQSTSDIVNELRTSHELNDILIDAIPHPALLVRKDRTVIAANKIAREQGAITGGFCWRDWGQSLYLDDDNQERAKDYEPDHANPVMCNFCKANRALDIDGATNIKTWLGDLFWDIYWVPTPKKDVYLHYAIDMTEEKKREEEIKYLSYHDKLTNIFNRAYFEDMLRSVDREENYPLSIIIGDINGLKITNDIFGHHEGDKLLKNTADVLKKVCCNEDIIARYGGDEFAVILPNTDSKQTEKICNRITKACAANGNDLVPSSISLGYDTKAEVGPDLHDTIKNAEDMMYRHKLLERSSMRNSLILSLEMSLHEKDLETKEHALRLVDTTSKVGQELGLTQIEMDDLNLLARLHDIGKITVDERILNKKEKLTKEELDEIKKHSEAGYRIAESSQTLTNISKYILSHHEWWNGAGYPQGLKGEDIPLLSRILSVADAFDAMTNNRPYRKAMTEEDAIAELKDKRGIQFDPHITDIFTRLIQNEQPA
ncbi:MAG: diguanylate cyclase [Gudongella sp.]|jgi:diguanylate cyclase (GGDEF)-like protein|nr:diguanylate cyclase [Gudongella sp.]